MDGRYLFRDVAADRILAKGRMEHDYLVNVCRVLDEKVIIAAPHGPAAGRSAQRVSAKTVVFFSEPYEASLCRTKEVYAAVLPKLAEVALASGCDLVLKLHPFESCRERQRLLNEILTTDQRARIQVVTGPLTTALLQQTRFGVTVSSTASLDCALEGVPAFLCTWFDRYGYGYARQLAKFDVAVELHDAEEIRRIPELLKSFRRASREDLWQDTEPKLLRELLLGNFKNLSSDGELAEKAWV
jgi:hypothetical protein